MSSTYPLTDVLRFNYKDVAPSGIDTVRDEAPVIDYQNGMLVLTHLKRDSVIVQIPLLRGKVNTRLDRVLSIFDQTQKSGSDQHTLLIDEALYADDSDMQAVLHRLLMAAANADMRQDMNVEDEYFSIIEKRDTEILIKDRQLAEKNVLLAEKDGQLAEKDGQLAEKDGQLAEKDGQLAEKDGQLAELLRTSVLSLHKAGLGAEAIAVTLNQDISIINSILR